MEKACMDFQKRQNELLEERVAALKQGKPQEYTSLVSKSLAEKRTMMNKVTQDALKFTSISEEDFNSSLSDLL